MERTASKHMVSLLDTSEFCRRGENFLRQKFPQDYPATKNFRLETLCEIGVVEKNKQHFLINTEGIMQVDPIEWEGVSIPLYGKYFDENGKETGIDAFPIITFNVSNINCDEVLTQVKEDGKISLDKFIRTFGSRLESNFRYAEHFLSE